MANILHKYLDSGGREIACDLAPYETGGIKDNLCVFCEEAHDYHDVYIIYEDMHKSFHTKAHACDACEREIEEMLEVRYSFSKAEVVRAVETSGVYDSDPVKDDEPDWGDDKAYDEGRYGNPDLGNSLRSEEKKWKEQIDNKLANLNNFYKFPEDVYKFYLHLDPRFDTYAKPDSCCICHNKITDVNSPLHLQLEVPVYPDDCLTGGRVAICTYCSKKLPRIFGKVVKLIEERAIFQEKCCVSGQSYYIYADEHVHRNTYPTQKGEMPPTYMCPTEAYHLTVHGSDVLPGTGNGYARSIPPERYATGTGICSCSVKADLMMNPNYFHMFHRTKNKGKDILMCERCKDFRNKLGHDDNNIVELIGGGILIIDMNPVDLSGILYKLDYGSLLEISEVPKCESVPDLISKAIDIWSEL